MCISVIFPRISYSYSRPSLCPLTTLIMERPGVHRWENFLQTLSVRTARTIAYLAILPTKALGRGLLILATPAKANISRKGKRARRRTNPGNQRETKARNPKPLISTRLARKMETIRQTATIFLRLLISLRESRPARLNLVQWLSSEGSQKRMGVQAMMKMRTVYLLYLRSLFLQGLRVRCHSTVVRHHHHQCDLVFLP